MGPSQDFALFGQAVLQGGQRFALLLCLDVIAVSLQSAVAASCWASMHMRSPDYQLLYPYILERLGSPYVTALQY